jgi:hypothetical protein
MLAPLGFTLTFSLPEQTSTVALSPLPAQYHYEDGVGSALIYLAGRDCTATSSSKEGLPPHASRWLAYVGAKPEPLRRALRELAGRFSLDWQASQDPLVHDEEEAA